MSADVYRDDAPRTLKEALANEYNEVTWFPTGPAGSASRALSAPRTTDGPPPWDGVDISQH